MAFWMQGHQHKSNNMGHQSKSNSLKLSYLHGQNIYSCSSPKFLNEGGHKKAYRITVNKSVIQNQSAPQIKSGTVCALKVKKREAGGQFMLANSRMVVKQRDGWKTELNELDRLEQYCRGWNKISTKPIYTNNKCVLKVEHTFKSANLTLQKGEYVFIEPLLPGFDKFNHPCRSISSISNGNKDDYALSVQAFCHYSYHISGGRQLVCDAQGYRGPKCYVLTDPYYLSKEAHITEFFKKHVCNQFCNRRVIKTHQGQLIRQQEQWRFPEDVVARQLNPFVEQELQGPWATV